MGCIVEWEKIYKEKGERMMWASIGASALITALVLTVCWEAYKKWK